MGRIQKVISEYELADCVTLDGEGSSPDDIRELMDDNIENEEIELPNSQMNRIFYTALQMKETGHMRTDLHF